MLGNLTGVHLLIILGIVVLLFGATKLPALAKGIGQSLNIFRSEIHAGDSTKAPAPPAGSSVTHDATIPSHE